MITEIPDNKRLILFWILFAVLLFARLFFFGSIPGDINQDEAMAGYNAYTLLHHGQDSFGNSFPMYLVAWGSGMNALESYLAIPFVALFGMHSWVIRLVPLIISMLSLVTVYKLVRDFVKNDTLAFFTMLVTGVSPWHIMLSRWALESNLAPAFLLFGLYFFLKGTIKDKYYILSAVFYGLSLYAYATVWIVVPFILIVQCIYLLYTHRLKFTKNSVIAVVVLAVLAVPAILFLFVNKGIINEIRTPFFTIPRLVDTRFSEVSLSQIPENLKNLWSILWKQDDGLLWNSTPEFGIIYRFSMPFTIIGLIAMLYPYIDSLRKRINNRIATGNKQKKAAGPSDGRISVTFFVMVQLIAGIVIGALVSVNVNRVNIIFLPLIGITAYGWYFVFTKIRWIRERLVFVPVVIYLFSFAGFELYYFTEYKENINSMFCEGIEDAFEFVGDELKDFEHVYVTPYANYARVLFYDRTDVNEYLSTVKYTNYPSQFLDVESFGRYSFYFDTNSPPDGTSVYVLDGNYTWEVLVRSMEDSGYKSYTSGAYTVYYPVKH